MFSTILTVFWMPSATFVITLNDGDGSAPALGLGFRMNGVRTSARHSDHHHRNLIQHCNERKVHYFSSSSMATKAFRLAKLPRLTALTRQASRQIIRPASSSCSPSFPCVDAHAARESRLKATTRASSSASPLDHPASGPEPAYARPNPASYNIYHHSNPLTLAYSSTPLPSFDIAYETWGTLSPARDNVILLHTGLSASSHAAATSSNPADGWWQKFIGSGKALDTDHFFIICTNVLGGCYGSTGPSSINPETERPYATTFPILSIFDMVRAQFCLLDHLKIDKLYASVGCSMGAMQSLAAGWLNPDRVGKIVSISGTARSSPSSVAMRYAQRSGALHLSFFSLLYLIPPL
jgi:hypothetical protein